MINFKIIEKMIFSVKNNISASEKALEVLLETLKIIDLNFFSDYEINELVEMINLLGISNYSIVREILNKISEEKEIREERNKRKIVRKF